MNMSSATDGWDGSFTHNLQSNVRYAREAFGELGTFMESATYHEAPTAVRIAVSVAWVRAKEDLALFRGCIADFCAPWFDGSAFPKRSDRYAVRVTGPAGHSRYLTLGGGETDQDDAAYAYSTAGAAWGAAGSYQRTEANVVCDVVNLDDPEDSCREQ